MPCFLTQIVQSRAQVLDEYLPFGLEAGVFYVTKAVRKRLLEQRGFSPFTEFNQIKETPRAIASN